MLSPEGSRVLFTAQALDTNHRDLFSAAIDGSKGAVQLTFGHVFVTDFQFSPDGARAVYQAVATLSGLYSALVDGSQPPLWLFPHPGQAYPPYSISPDGAWVVCRVDVHEPQRFELFARPIDGSQAALQLSDPLAPDGDVGGSNGESVSPAMRITPDSSHVLYGADQDFDEVFELFASPLPALP